MLSERFSQSFYSYIESHHLFSHHEKAEIVELFKNKTVQVIFSVSLYLIIWSFCVAFIDATLLTRGTILSLKRFGIFNSFLPSFIFILFNAIVKFIFIYTYTKRRIEVALSQIFVGIIPIVGSLFFTAYLLKNKPLIARALKDYLAFIRKDFKWIGILKNK